MICNNCRKAIPDNSNFCTFCRSKLNSLTLNNTQTRTFKYAFNAAARTYLKTMVIVFLIFPVLFILGIVAGNISGGTGNLDEGAAIGLTLVFLMMMGFGTLTAFLVLYLKSGYDKKSYITINDNGNVLGYYCVATTGTSRNVFSEEMYYTINNIVKIEEEKNRIIIYGDIEGKHISGVDFLPQSSHRIEIKKIYENMDYIVGFIKSKIVTQSKTIDPKETMVEDNLENRTGMTWVYSEKIANKSFNRVLVRNLLLCFLLFIATILLSIPITLLQPILGKKLPSLIISILLNVSVPFLMLIFMGALFWRAFSSGGWYKDNYISLKDSCVEIYIKRGLMSVYHCKYIVRKIDSIKETKTHLIIYGDILKYRSDWPDGEYKAYNQLKILKVFDNLDQLMNLLGQRKILNEQIIK